MLYYIPDGALQGGGFMIATVVAAAAFNIPVVAQNVYVGGYYTSGDGGAANYIRANSEPAHSGKFQDALGAWFEIVETKVTPEMFGAVGDNVTDDYNAWQGAIDYLESLGGGELKAWPSHTYNCETAIIIKSNVHVDMLGCTLNSNLTGTSGIDYGPSAYSDTSLKNGTFNTISSGSIGSQGIWHSGFSLGNALGDTTDDLPNLGPRERIRNVRVSNMTFSTNAPGKLAVAVMGDVQAVFDQITIPDSSTMYGAFSADWSYVGVSGSVVSSDVPGTRTNFDNGDCYTTHPSVICTNWNIGILSRDVGAQPEEKAVGIRLSGCYASYVAGNRITSITGVAYENIAGDLGMEFALSGLKSMAMRDTIFENNHCFDCNNSIFIASDTYADNVQAAVDASGYVPLMPTIVRTNSVFRNMNGQSDSGASVSNGLRIWFSDGYTYQNIRVQGFDNGIEAQEEARNFIIDRCVSHNNRQAGIKVDQGLRNPPINGKITNCEVYGNGTDAGTPTALQTGIYIGRSINITVDGNLIGDVSEATQDFGIYVIDSTPTGVVITNNYVRDVDNGFAYRIFGASNYGLCELFANNNCDSSISNKYAGVNIIPIENWFNGAGNKNYRYSSSRLTLSSDITPPSGFVGNVGDIITLYDPASSGNFGSICVTGGAVGSGAAWAALNTRA